MDHVWSNSIPSDIWSGLSWYWRCYISAIQTWMRITATRARLLTTTDLRPPLFLLPIPHPFPFLSFCLLNYFSNSERSTFVLCNQILTLIKISFKMSHFIATEGTFTNQFKIYYNNCYTIFSDTFSKKEGIDNHITKSYVEKA